MKKRFSKWRLASLVSMLTLLLTGCGEPFLSTLQPAGEVAKEQYNLMLLSTWIMVGVVAIVSVIFVYVIFKFRRKKGDENTIPKQVEGSHVLEIVWTVVPIALLLILAVPTVSATFKQADVAPMLAETRDENALVVNVTAKLYWWEFEYPDYGIITSQELVMPVGEKVYFNLQAADVKHSFWVPALGGKLDTNVDGVNQFYLEADRADLFYGKCAELCGPSHALMDFKVLTLPREEFDAWLVKMQNTDGTVAASTDAVKQGEELFTTNGCIACHAVSANDARPAAARLGPNLANFADRSRVAGILDHDEEKLSAWIKDNMRTPEMPGSAIKPGNKMYGTYGTLTDDEISALSQYLLQLSVE